MHTPEFKAKVGLEALRGARTINEIGQEFSAHPVQVGQWKKEIQEQAKTLFKSKRSSKPVAAHSEQEVLYSEIGKLKVELDWLKNSGDQPIILESSVERIGVCGFPGAWRRCNSLRRDGMTMQQSCALPCTRKTAHSNPFNGAF